MDAQEVAHMQQRMHIGIILVMKWISFMRLPSFLYSY